MIAPFAFLGSDYDDVLQEVYTSGIAERLVDSPNFLHVLFGAGLFGNTRLRELVARYVGQEALAAVAEESEGRRLLVATTDLDTQRTAIWDMGRIAEVETPEALSLFRDVMAASASIPLVFPPILISAKADGKEFQEMHVDGGVTAPILTLPNAFLLEGRSLPAGHRLNIYLLLNNKLERDFELVPNSAIDVASRAISSVTKSQTRSIVFSTYEFARRNRLDFHLTFIDRKVPSPSSPSFDTTYMRGLYQYGYEKARGDHAWTAIPSRVDLQIKSWGVTKSQYSRHYHGIPMKTDDAGREARYRSLAPATQITGEFPRHGRQSLCSEA